MTNGISGGFNNPPVISEAYAYTATSKVENIKNLVITRIDRQAPSSAHAI